MLQTTMKTLLLLIVVRLATIQQCLCIHQRVLNRPARQTVLWRCAGLSVDDCCRVYLWSLWYPYNPALAANNRYNRLALARPAEAYLANRTVPSIVNSLMLTPLGCMDTRDPLPPRNSIRFTGTRYWYPCRHRHHMRFWQARARFNATFLLWKGECILEKKWQDTVKKAERNCLRALAKGMNRFVRLSAVHLDPAHTRAKESRAVLPGTGTMVRDSTATETAQAISDHYQLPGRLKEVPRLTLVDLDATDPDDLGTQVSQSWKSQLSLENPIEGHTYVGCAIGGHDNDVVLKLSFI